MRRTPISCVALLAACTPSHPYTIADRETFDAIAPEYGAYVMADKNLSEDQKKRRAVAVQTWRLRIEAAEAATR